MYAWNEPVALVIIRSIWVDTKWLLWRLCLRPIKLLINEERDSLSRFGQKYELKHAGSHSHEQPGNIREFYGVSSHWSVKVMEMSICLVMPCSISISTVSVKGNIYILFLVVALFWLWERGDKPTSVMSLGIYISSLLIFCSFGPLCIWILSTFLRHINANLWLSVV